MSQDIEPLPAIEQPSTAAGDRAVIFMRRAWPAQVLVLLVALVSRLGMVLHSAGGLRGTFGNDPDVYYAAADALVNGRMPYRDYVLLHPPAIALVLAPFAWLGDLTTDHRGFIVATVAFILIGSINAVLVVRVAEQLGFGTGPALVGGLAYAAWPGAVGGEYAIRLEPLGNLLALCGLLAYARAQSTPRRRWPLVCGALFGAACSVKIWYVVPLLLVLAWQLSKTRRAAPLTATGAVMTGVVINVPFFAVAPGRMWSMVITDQLNRNFIASPVERLTGVTGIWKLNRDVATHYAPIIVAAGGIGLVVLCVLAARAPGSGFVLSLLFAQLAMLGLSPSWFAFYDAFLAVGLSLTVAAAARTIAARWIDSRQRARRVAAPTVGAIVALLVVVTVVVPDDWVLPYPADRLRPAVAHSGCVMSDAPMPLIEMNVLSRDLSRGCPNWIDVGGRAYGQHAAALDVRRRDPRWQRDLTRYLLSGDTLTLWGGHPGIGPRLARLIRSLPVLSRAGRFTVWQTGDQARR